MTPRKRAASAACALATVASLVVFGAPSALAAPPDNDMIANATLVPVGGTSVSGTTAEATLEAGEYTYNSGTSSVWYTWTAAESGDATFSTCGAAGGAYTSDPTIAVFNFGQLTGPLAWNDDFCDLGAQVTLAVEAGMTYSIQVNTYSSGQTSVFTMTFPAAGSMNRATKDLSVWLQSVGRPASDSTCPEGYTPSWAEWPNDGTGGWVCDKRVYTYYPWETVQ